MRKFEETELTKLVVSALENAVGHLMSRGIYNDPEAVKFDELIKKIKEDKLDVSFTSREL